MVCAAAPVAEAEQAMTAPTAANKRLRPGMIILRVDRLHAPSGSGRREGSLRRLIRCAAWNGCKRGLRSAWPCREARIDPRWRHAAIYRDLLCVLAGVVRGTAGEHFSARLRNDAEGSRARIGCSARPSFRAARFRGLRHDRRSRYSRLLSHRVRHRAAVPQRQADRLEEGLAAAQVVLTALDGAALRT